MHTIRVTTIERATACELCKSHFNTNMQRIPHSIRLQSLLPFFCRSTKPWPGFLNMARKAWQGHARHEHLQLFPSNINAPCSHKPGFYMQQNAVAAGFSSSD
jgi:hypothetical protein